MPRKPPGTGEGTNSGAESDDEWVALGAITRPHGVRGDARIHPFNEASKLLGKVPEVALRDERGALEVRKISRARRAPKVWIVHLDGCHGPEDVDALRKREVCVKRSQMPALRDDEFYLRDAVGLRVVRTTEEGDEDLGEVVQVMFYPTMECLRCRFSDGVRELPIVRPWVERVDIEAGVVRVGDLSDLPLEEGRAR